MNPVPIVSWPDVNVITEDKTEEHFAEPGPYQHRIAASTAFTGRVLPMSPLYQNYSYTLTFPAPRLQCGDSRNQILNNLPFYTEDSFVQYNATVASKHLFNSDDGPQKEYYGMLFRTPTSNFSCEVWNTSYTATFSFVDGEQQINIGKIEPLNQFFTKVPTSSDFEDYTCRADLCSYQGWFSALAAIFEGFILSSSSRFQANTKIVQTNLIGCSEMSEAADGSRGFRGACPASSLMRAVEILSENTTLSYFGNVPTVWV